MDGDEGTFVTELGALASLLFGVTLLVSPLYWPALALVGVAPLLDPLGAIGVVPSGAYYAALAGAYLAAGLAGIRYGDTGGSVRALSGVALLSLVPTVGVTLGSYALRFGVVGVTPLVLAVGVVPATLGLPLGAGTTAEERRWLLGFAAILLLPYGFWVYVNVGLATSTIALLAYLSVPLLAVMDVVWAAPLFWLGRRLRSA